MPTESYSLRNSLVCFPPLTSLSLRPPSQLTQVLSLVAYPSIAYGVALCLWRTKLNASLVSGLVVCLSTSTTASTHVVFTNPAGGNEALALVNAVIGNVIGIFLTPAWIKAFVSDHTGGTASVPYATVIKQLVITVVAPLIAGNCLQHYCPTAVAAVSKRVNLSKLSSLMILLLVWATFSNTFAKHVTADGGSVVAIVALTLGFYCLFTAFALWLPISCAFARRHLQASEADAIAMAMCAGTKTVALGIPIITAVFAHNPQQGIISLPLIIYHAEQILLGNLLTKPLKRWVRRCEARREADGGGQGAPGAGAQAVANGVAMEEGAGQGGQQRDGAEVNGAAGDSGG